MASRGQPARPIPELEQFVIGNVQPTGVELGNGAYGAVEEVRIPGAICAAKKMHEILIKSATPQEQKIMSDVFLRECTLLSRLRHPHIVQFLGVCYLPGSRLPLLVMERLLMSLDDLLENKTMSLPFDAKLSFLRDVAKGLVFLHSQTPPVIHRDLTARNVLLNSSMVAKIADLGVARIVNIQPGKVAATMTKNPGNVVYMPPEAAEESAKYSTALDMFSYGNLAIFTLSRLFPDLKAATYLDSKTRNIIGRSEVKRRDDVFQQLYTELGEEHELVRLSTQCLSNDPEERPPATRVMERLSRVNPTGRNWEKTKLELLQDVATAESEGAAVKEKDVDDPSKKVDDKDNQLVKLQEENLSLHQTVTSLTEQIQLLQKQVQDKEKENEALERRNQILQQQVRSQEVQLQEKKEQAEIDLASLPDHVKTSTSQEKKEPEDIDLPGLPDYLKSPSSAELLRKNLSLLYQHLDPAKVLPVMPEKLILTPSEAEELSSYQHDSAKSMALVYKMFSKTGDAILSLIEALTAIPGQEYVGTRLKKELIDDIHKRKKRSLSTSDELSDQFLQLLEDVMVAFDNYPNGVNQLKQALSSLVLPLGKGKEAALVQPGVYQDAQTTREFFKCMSPYFNPLSTDLLQLLASLSGCDAAAKLVYEFVATKANNSHIALRSGKQQTEPLSSGSSSLESFHNTPLDKLQSTQSSVLARLPEHQTVACHKDAVRVSVQVNRSVMSLSDYDSLVTALCGFFRVPKAALAFVGCAENPLMLSWVVSAPVHEYMKSRGGGTSGEKMIAQERVMSIAVGQDTIYKCLTTEECGLHEASLYGVVEKVQCLLKLKDINVNAMVYNGWTPLKQASFDGHEKVVELLLTAGAKVDLQSKDGFTALYVACSKGHEKIVQLLIQAGANLNLQNNNGDTPLDQASFNGHEKVVELLLTAGSKVDLQDKDGYTALYSACSKGHEKIVQLLIQAGADLNLQTNNGWTPLFKACLDGREKVVELLLTAGAKVDLQNKNGWTALHSACSKGHEKIVQLLIQAGADLKLQNNDGCTALYVACQEGHDKIVQLLIQAGANLNLQSNNGTTPLMKASDNGHEKVVELLLTAGAKVDLQNKWSKTALSYARSKGHTSICRLLQNK